MTTRGEKIDYLSNTYHQEKFFSLTTTSENGGVTNNIVVTTTTGNDTGDAQGNMKHSHGHSKRRVMGD
jgi:hypothetical protein